jgi:hypothetical protein
MKTKSIVVVVLLLVSIVLMSAGRVRAGADPTVPGHFMDDFEREALLVPSGGWLMADGTIIYWNWKNKTSVDTIIDGVWNATFQDGGCFRFACNNAISWKYCIIRMKGNATALTTKMYIRLGAAERGDIDDSVVVNGTKVFCPTQHRLDSLLQPDGKPLPAMTSDFQDFIIDMAKSKLKFGPKDSLDLCAAGCSNAFQIGTWQAMKVDFDYIFMSNVNPLDPAAAVMPMRSNAWAASRRVSVSMTNNADALILRSSGPAAVGGTLSLYDLQGKLVQRTAIGPRQSIVPVARGILGRNIYFYTIGTTAGAIFAKGKITIR